MVNVIFSIKGWDLCFGMEGGQYVEKEEEEEARKTKEKSGEGNEEQWREWRVTVWYVYVGF